LRNEVYINSGVQHRLVDEGLVIYNISANEEEDHTVAMLQDFLRKRVHFVCFLSQEAGSSVRQREYISFASDQE